MEGESSGILIRNHEKCYLVFFDMICMEVLLLNNLHVCDHMGATKIYILIINKRGWQCMLGERAMHAGVFCPNTPAVSNCFVLYQNAYNGEHKTFMKFINIQNCINEKNYEIFHTMSKCVNMPIYKQKIGDPRKRLLV